MSGGLFYHFLSYFLEIASLTEPEVRLTACNLQQSSMFVPCQYCGNKIGPVFHTGSEDLNSGPHA